MQAIMIDGLDSAPLQASINVDVNLYDSDWIGEDAKWLHIKVVLILHFSSSSYNLYACI